MIERTIKRYYGRVMNVRVTENAIRVDVRDLESHGKMIPHVLVPRIAPGCLIVPEEGWIVAVDDDLGSDEKYVAEILCGPEFNDEESVQWGFNLQETEEYQQYAIADDMKEGSMVFQLDRNTAIIVRENPDDETKKDIELHASGDIKLNAGGTIEQNMGTADPTEPDGLTKEPNGGK